MNKGWIKLWRNNLDAGLLQNFELWTFWCWCLLKATHCPRKQMVGNQIVELEPGQFIFGRKAAAVELNTTEKKVRTFIIKLEKLENLAIKRTNKFSIITVINWEAYQQNIPAGGPTEGQQRANKGPAGGPQTRGKNGENVRSRTSSPNGDSSLFPDENASTSPEPAKRKTENEAANNGKKRSGHPPCPQEKIIKAYHEILPELPIVQSWNGASRKNLQTRWREDSTRQNLEWWQWFFQENVQKSDFLMGRVKEFRADMDWIVRQSNFQKILNGRYQNRGPNTGSRLTDQNVRVAQEWASEGLQ